MRARMSMNALRRSRTEWGPRLTPSHLRSPSSPQINRIPTQHPKLNILLVFASPKGTPALRLQKEKKLIQMNFLGDRKPMFDIDPLEAATVNTFQDKIFKRHYDLIHFSCHGVKGKPVLENALGQRVDVPIAPFAEELVVHKPQCLFLNWPESIILAKLCQPHIPYIVCIQEALTRVKAIRAFESGFYEAIAAGKPFEDAYEEGSRNVTIINAQCPFRLLTPQPVAPARPPPRTHGVLGVTAGNEEDIGGWTSSNTAGDEGEQGVDTSTLIAERPRTIAVTGTLNAGDDRRLRRCVEDSLEPLLGRDTHWLVGSWGQVDEAVADYLAQNGEAVTIVGYTAQDLSPSMFQLAEACRLPFLNAGAVRLPPLAQQASNPREALFLTRADLVVFFWANQSQGVKSLIDWYISNDKDVLVCTI
eukprot:gnl/Trimastix_PCT/4584.p1 GENE.gnl/Trimastix_PCT/4584~~gnl/Trimastix_PCT/4584.p1  ORF type:complete len:418 (-),score=79.77 gnl/Trimastix_PCT/4584:85-1338(-)